MSWQLVSDDATLREVLERHTGAGAVAVDTEFMRRNTFYPQVALLQLCFDDKAWLVDPLSIRDTAPLQALMRDPGLVKVLHSPSEDLEVFRQWLGELPRPLFDTQRAVALLGEGFGLGYRALVERICGVDLPKEETRSDWLQRPLSDAQCEYAAQDVTYLLTVYQQLRETCQARGRLDWVLADGADAVALQEGPPASYYPRIKSAWKLDRRQLGALAALCAWREDTARTRDKPRSWIIDDQACLQLARLRPDSRARLRAEVELPAAALRRYGDDILGVLARQAETPDEELPAPLPAPPSARQREQGKKLRKEARTIAEQLDVVPEILLQARDYDALIRESTAGNEVEIPLHWQGWRREVVIEPLRRLLREGAV